MSKFLPPLTKRAEAAELDEELSMYEQSPTPAPLSRAWVRVVLSGIGLTLSLVAVLIGGAITVQSFPIRAEPPQVVVQYDPDSVELLSYGPQPLFREEAFYKRVRESFLTEKHAFIEADLSTMEIRYYEEGEVKFEVPIASKGRKGSWWETPAGLYAIEYKTENHFSSFGQVDQPWSMVFQGNFFVHGWPQYKNGEPVPEGYSGGCIRLTTEHAEALYALVAVGTPILVYESAFGREAPAQAPLPDVSAENFVIADLDSATVLARSDTEGEVRIASLTNLMTALVAADYLNFDRTVTISSAPLASSTVPRLTPGMQLSAYSLLYPLLRESSSEAAEVLAQLVGRKRFIGLMNEKATALGMKRTVFVDPFAGGANVSTLDDQLRLAQHIFENRRALLSLSAGERDTSHYDIYSFEDLQNFNETDGLAGFMGGLVGKPHKDELDDSLESALVVYEMDLYGTPRTVVFIVLGASDPHEVIETLHTYVKTLYGGFAPRS